jgi:receptor expression-enhancing protein 5/6
VILGLAGVYFFLVFFNIAGEFLVNFAGFLLPGYYSLQALFTSGTADDTQVSFNALGRMSPILMRSNANC